MLHPFSNEDHHREDHHRHPSHWRHCHHDDETEEGVTYVWVSGKIIPSLTLPLKLQLQNTFIIPITTVMVFVIIMILNL